MRGQHPALKRESRLKCDGILIKIMKQRLYKVESIMSVTLSPVIQYHITINIEKMFLLVAYNKNNIYVVVIFR